MFFQVAHEQDPERRTIDYETSMSFLDQEASTKNKF